MKAGLALLIAGTWLGTVTPSHARVAPDGQSLIRHRDGVHPPNSALALSLLLVSGLRSLERAGLTVKDGDKEIPIRWEAIQRWPRYGGADVVLIIRPKGPRKRWPAGRELTFTARVGNSKGSYKVKIGKALDRDPPRVEKMGAPVYDADKEVVSIPYSGLKETPGPIVLVELELYDPKAKRKKRKAKVMAFLRAPPLFHVNAERLWCLARGRVVDLAGNSTRLPKAPCSIAK